MSQIYKIVERLRREAELKRAAAMDCYGDRRDTLNREAAEDDQAASLIQELGEALEGARQFILNGVELGYIHVPRNDPAEHTLRNISAILSKLKET